MYNFPQESLECTQVRSLIQSFTKNQLLLLQTNKQLISFSEAPAQPEEAADQGGRAACRAVEVIGTYQQPMQCIIQSTGKYY